MNKKKMFANPFHHSCIYICFCRVLENAFSGQNSIDKPFYWSLVGQVSFIIFFRLAPVPLFRDSTKLSKRPRTSHTHSTRVRMIFIYYKYYLIMPMCIIASYTEHTKRTETWESVAQRRDHRMLNIQTEWRKKCSSIVYRLNGTEHRPISCVVCILIVRIGTHCICI